MTAIFGLLAAVSMIAIGALRGGSDLQNEAQMFQRVLELARNRTIASEGDARYGVYVDVSTNPHQYVLFQGNDYATRQVNEDEVYTLGSTIEFASVSFGGGSEVVFDRIEGTTSQSGNVVLRVKIDPTNIKTVYVESSGSVEINSSIAPTDDDRQKDSRHVHIDYNGRTIVTATEQILLDFGTTTHTIVMQDYISGGQLVWEDSVNVDGQGQKLKIYTHQLNGGAGSNETKFSVHRDRRFNTKALTIEIVGYAGTLIQYDAVGVITPGTSAYVSATVAQ